MGFQKKSEKSAMCAVPKPLQPPQGAYFDTLTVLYQNEKGKNTVYSIPEILF